MIVKKFKLKKEIVNILRYRDSLEERGWRLVVENDDYWLEPIIINKMLSSCFTIFFLKKVFLSEVDQKLIVEMKADFRVLSISLTCLFLLFTSAYSRGEGDLSLLIMTMVFFLFMSFITIFFTLRSELVGDLKKCIIVKL